MSSSGISWRTRSLPDLVERLLECKVHVACGTEPAQYRRLWPSEARFPGSSVDHFLPVLVDRSVGRTYDPRTKQVTATDPRKIMDAGHLLPYAMGDIFQSTGSAGTTEGMDRYVMFVRTDPDRKGWTPDEVRLPKNEVHLNVLEGVFLAIQYPDLLNDIGFDCLGSYVGEPNMVASFDKRKHRTFLRTRDVNRPQPHMLYATRHRFIDPIL